MNRHGLPSPARVLALSLSGSAIIFFDEYYDLFHNALIPSIIPSARIARPRCTEKLPQWKQSASADCRHRHTMRMAIA
jgi:hypothetical protein